MLRICQAHLRALRYGGQAHVGTPRYGGPARVRAPRDCGRAIAAIAYAVALLAAACSKSSPPPPEVTPPAGGETINGTERLGWTQRAADAVELSAVRYAIYVDGTRSELAGASCAPAAAADGFACSARLPTLTAGAHTIELASFVTDGSLLESARSAPLRVTVVTQVESAAKTTAERLGSKSSDTTIRPVALADGTRLAVEPVAGGLNRPADLAFTPDGRLLIAQRDGTIRSVRDGRLSEPDSLSDRWATGDRLLAIAIDPDFARTRFVFAIVAAGGTFSLIRVREVGGTFGDRAILLGGISAAALEPAASLRFGPDRRLYAAFDDGGDSRQVGDAASPNGKILRLNADGTTPDDQAGASPIYAAGSSSPAGLDWQPGTEVLWMADAAQGGIMPVTAESTGDGKRIRGVARAPWRLPAALVPTAMAFTRGTSGPALAGNLFVASGTGHRLLRIRFDPLDPSRVAATEPVLQGVAGPLVAIAAGPDGAIYFATADSVWRIAPGPTR
jgi:glucose/arabinose dehydrogenase